jgi:hypothetical protein
MLTYAVALVAIIALVTLYRRDRYRLKGQRARFFDDCLDLFQSYQVTQEGPTFPALSGRYRDHEVRLHPVIDDMACRKIPVLWLKVTILQPSSYRGVLDFLVRPGGVEVYSPSAELHYHLTLPEGWPQQSLLCTDDPSSIPPLKSIDPHMGLFADAYMKELVVTGQGVRLVRMIGQASPLHYAAFREVKFEGIQLNRAVVQALLDAAIGIAVDIADAHSGRASAEQAA